MFSPSYSSLASVSISVIPGDSVQPVGQPIVTTTYWERLLAARANSTSQNPVSSPSEPSRRVRPRTHGPITDQDFVDDYVNGVDLEVSPPCLPVANSTIQSTRPHESPISAPSEQQRRVRRRVLASQNSEEAADEFNNRSESSD